MELSPQAFFILVSFFFTFLFGIIALLYLFGPTPKKETQSQSKEVNESSDKYKEIMEVLDNPKSNRNNLEKVAHEFFEYYDKMDLSSYKKKAFLFALATHKNATSEIILYADESLQKLNPDMRRELGTTLNNALNVRGI